MSVRDEIIEAAARALWVCAYADHVEDFENSKHDYPESAWADRFCPASLDESATCPVFGTHDRPGGGEDWFDYAPPTGDAARVKARELIEEIEHSNWLPYNTEHGIAGALEHCSIDWEWNRVGKRPTAEDFGHYLAMEALGHGVSWSDDHPAHGLKVPHIEFYL